MAAHIQRAAPSSDELYRGDGARVLVIEAPYYKHITDELIAGAAAILGDANVAFDRIAVTGALEIPLAFAEAVAAGHVAAPPGKAKYAGVIAVGCVIRGETSHYDIVCNNANHWLMETAIKNAIPLGNAILTVDTASQALARARGGSSGKGGDAARACLRLMWLSAQFEKSKT